VRPFFEQAVSDLDRSVANARFSLLKLLIYEPYYCYALVGWSARPRLEP
jgi:hypothetical protein